MKPHLTIRNAPIFWFGLFLAIGAAGFIVYIVVNRGNERHFNWVIGGCLLCVVGIILMIAGRLPAPKEKGKS